MNASRTFAGPTSGLAQAEAVDQDALKPTVAVSVGLGGFRFELNIGRNAVDNFHQPGVRAAVLRRLRITDDDQKRARESRLKEMRGKRYRSDGPKAPSGRAISGNASGRDHERPPQTVTPPSDDAPPNFWDALSPAQQQEFRLMAEGRTFAAGARLMEEGEAADYVIVILDGRTRITVRGSNGVERVVAHRGPGQLVGERAALRVNVRSATVVTLDQVQALAMTTADFAAYLTNHPDVLQLVEEQVYERLTKVPEEGAPVAAPSVPARQTAPANHRESEARPPAPLMETPQWDGQNCTTIFSDVVSYGSPERSEAHRQIIRREVLDMTRVSLRAIWGQCHYEDRGDGLLVVVPPSIPTVQILEYLLIALPIALKRHNRIYAEGAQIQLRVALDVGPVTTDELGVSGQVIINAARLLDAPPFKDSMECTHAPLGMIVSDFVYQTAVSGASSLTDPASYAEINVQVKKTRLHGWTLLVEPPVDPSPRKGSAVTV